jgi:hypothetical protein
MITLPDRHTRSHPPGDPFANHALASNTRLKGVSLARRNSRKPQIAGLSIRRKRDDHSSVVMDEPLTFDALIPRDEIDAGPTPGIA